MSQQFCLKWNNHMNNMMDVFKNLLSTEAMVDVTLACDGLSLKAHKIVLSACSPFFQSLFLENPCKHPIVILKDMKYSELKAIIEFMYHGEVNVAQEQLSALMKTAETLRVKGLAEVTNEKNQSGDESRSASRTGTPPPKRKKRTRKRSVSDQSDDGASESRTKRPDSDIEELSSDIDRSTPYSVASSVPLQSHRTSSFHKSQQEQQPVVEPNVEESFVSEEKFSIEPSKLLQQTLTDDHLQRRSGRSSVQSNLELQRRPQSSTDHSSNLLPVASSPMTSNALVSDQQPQSPIDIKPEILDLEPPMSPVAGPSHGTDENSMMYMDQSNMSTMSEPSGYQDNSSALVPTDSQSQVTVKLENVIKSMEKLSSIVIQNAQVLAKLTGDSSFSLPTTFSPCKSVSELQTLEEKLKTDEEFSKMAQALSALGGRTDAETTRRIISSIVGHELALRMSWINTPYKKAISEFPYIIKLITTAVKMNKRFKDVTQMTVENHIKRWLRYASDRYGGRNKRKIKA